MKGRASWSVVEGRLTSACGELRRGDSVLIPYSTDLVLTVAEDALVLMTYNFTEEARQRDIAREARNCSVEELATAWIEQQREEEEGSWAIHHLIDLCGPTSDPEMAWPVILRLVELSTDDLLLSYVAAGPLEDFLGLAWLAGDRTDRNPGKKGSKVSPLPFRSVGLVENARAAPGANQASGRR